MLPIDSRALIGRYLFGNKVQDIDFSQDAYRTVGFNDQYNPIFSKGWQRCLKGCRA
jgi:hypothetical protein